MIKSADAFRTISEVADWLGVQTHVLRFWESKFSQIKPVKRAGGRRYYRPVDMLLLGGIRKLLHGDGLTIKGVQKILREEGIAYVSDMSGPLEEEVTAQIEGDLAGESGFVEVELAPISATEDTVTLFPTGSLPDMAEPESVAEHTPEHQPDVTSEPTFTVNEPEPQPLFSLTELDMPEAFDAPDVAEDRPASDPFAAEPEPLFEISEKPATPEDEPQEYDLFLKPATGLDNANADQQDAGDALPDLPLMPDLAPIEAEPLADLGATPQETELNTGTDEEPTAFAIEHPIVSEDEAKVSVLPSFLSAPMSVSESQQEPALSKPRIVDVPEDVDPETLNAVPSILSHVMHVRHLTAAQRSAVRPILAQLTALRDQMAQTRSPHSDQQ